MIIMKTMKKLILITMMLLIVSCSSTTGFFKQYPTIDTEIIGVPTKIIQSATSDYYVIEVETSRYGVIDLITPRHPKMNVIQAFQVRITYYYDRKGIKSVKERI